MCCFLTFPALCSPSGAVAAVFTLKFLIHGAPEADKTLGHAFLNASLSPMQGFAIEFTLGFLLLFAVCGTGDENRPESRFGAPLVVGCVVIVCQLSFEMSTIECSHKIVEFI